MTYIRTHEGWLYLAVIVDLFSRRVVGVVDEQPHRRSIGCDGPEEGTAEPQTVTWPFTPL